MIAVLWTVHAQQRRSTPYINLWYCISKVRYRTIESRVSVPTVRYSRYLCTIINTKLQFRYYVLPVRYYFDRHF
jgi:hypothetical protein